MSSTHYQNAFNLDKWRVCITGDNLPSWFQLLNFRFVLSPRFSLSLPAVSLKDVPIPFCFLKVILKNVLHHGPNLVYDSFFLFFFLISLCESWWRLFSYVNHFTVNLTRRSNLFWVCYRFKLTLNTWQQVDQTLTNYYKFEMENSAPQMNSF